MGDVKPEELKVLNLLGTAWDAFTEIRPRGDAETEEFMHGVHRLQDLIGARAVWRSLDRRIPATKDNNDG